MNFYIWKQNKRLESCKKNSISLDESTDINNIAQLIICLRTVNVNFVTFEEILAVVSLHGNATADLIYDAIKKNFLYVMDKSKLSSICTDGANVLRGKKNGLLRIPQRNGVNCPAFHCIIHQQALFSKEVGRQGTVNAALKIINRLKRGHKALTHRKFKEFLKELEIDYGDVLLYTEVRWLSHGKSLERLYNFRKEIAIFS